MTDSSHLERWERRYIARGLGMRPDLAAMAASNPYTTGRLSKPTDEAGLLRNRAAGFELDRIVAEAAETAGIHESANYGTAFHEFTEPGSLMHVPPIGHLQEDVRAQLAWWATHGVLHLATEVFTANDITMSAGTFDNLSYVPGYGVCVTDKKTGAVNPEEWEVQLASYSHGEVYDPATDKRQSLEEYALARFPDADFNPDVGMVFRTYWDAKREESVVEAYELDLVGGWERAQLAAQIRDSRGVEKVRAEKRIEAGLKLAREVLARRIPACADYEALTALHAMWKHVWTDEHTVLAQQRLAEAKKEDA